MKKVFITGASGLLGGNITRELLKRNYQVIALTEPGLNAFTIKDLPITLISGDILDPGSYEPAMAQCRFVIHAAASTSVWPNRSEQVREINITGTQNICNSARKLGIEKIVHVGTANTYGYGSEENPGTESEPFNSGEYGLDYIDSKKEVHEWILSEVAQNELPATIVNPTFMIGPYDSKPSSGEMVRSFYQGKIPGFTPGGRNFIHVGDVATGVVNALEKGKIGQGYILGNRNLHYKEFFEIMEKELKRKAPSVSMPKWVMLAIAYLNCFVARIGRFAPKTYPAMVHIAYDEQFFSANKAIQEIDLPQTPIEQAVRDCFNWMKANNYL